MSLFPTLISTAQDHYTAFREQYWGTLQILAIAAIGTLCAVMGIWWQKYFLSVIFLLISIVAGAFVLYQQRTKLDRKQLNTGWQLLLFAVSCLLLREIFILTLNGISPFFSIVRFVFTILSQIAFTLGLVLLAWPTKKSLQIRAFIDSHIIVLALLVMAWTKEAHLFRLHLLHQDTTIYSLMLWINTISVVVLMISIFFYFIAAHSSPRPDRSTLWVSTGATFFFLTYTFRSYAVEGASMSSLSLSWLELSCAFTIFAILFVFIGLLWYQSAKPFGKSDASLTQAHSDQRIITLWLPYSAALIVSLILLIDEIIPNQESSGLLPVVLLLIAILSRQMLTMWDNLRLSTKLTSSNLNLENSVLERTQHLAILHSITSTLNSSLDKNSVLKIALEQIMKATKAEQGAIWLRNNDVIAPDITDWQLAYANGFPSKHHEHALRDVAIALVDDNISLTTEKQNFFHKVYNFPIDSSRVLAAPIRSGGLLLGTQALIVNSEKSNYDTRSVVESVALELGTSLQNAQLYQEARQRADRDGVTGLYNHRAIQEQLGTLLRDAQKTGETFSVLMMDMNDFKYFNDTYGHPVGDDVLRNVATQLKKISGPNNPVGRYGGDEFIILLPGKDHKQAHDTYLSVLETMEKEHFEVAPGVRIPISMSYGWSVFPDDGDNALDLITIADANLYRYKQRGELEEESIAMNRKTSDDKSTAFGVLDALITAIDNKDHYTRKHSDEVSHYALLIAAELGYSAESLRTVRISALLHDVGKIAVPDDILRHPGKLSKADWEIMKGHPTFGALIVKDLPNLEEVITGIRYHHERWDGKGYPDGLAGTDIPIMGRLLAVPDTYSALTTNRPYRKGHSPQEALLEIKRSILTQFDPLIAKTFIEVMKRELGIDDLKEANQSPSHQPNEEVEA